MSNPILLYDGVCGLCNRFVQFILRRDAAGVFRFAALQSGLAGRVLGRHGKDARDLDAVYVVVDYELPGERVLARADAVIFILGHLGAAELCSARPGLRPGPTRTEPTRAKTTRVPTQAEPTQAPDPMRTGPLQRGRGLWRFAGLLLGLVPRTVRDWGYGLIARNRYRMFGRYDTCPAPGEDVRGRFLE